VVEDRTVVRLKTLGNKLKLLPSSVRLVECFDLLGFYDGPISYLAAAIHCKITLDLLLRKFS
jgi:hypothetical protein